MRHTRRGRPIQCMREVLMRKGLLFAVCAGFILAGLSWLDSGIAQPLGQMPKPSTALQTNVPAGGPPIDRPRLDRLALPDLVPVSCFFNPSSAAPGTQNIVLTVKYRNQGTADALIASKTWEWTAARDQSSSNNISWFNSGDAVTLKPGAERGAGTISSSPSLLPPGTYTYTVRIDPQNAVAESNELNNEMTCTLTILAPGGDLKITNMVLNPAAPDSAHFNCVYVTVTNVGKEALTIPANTLMVSAPPFAQDATVSQTSPGVMQPGTSWTYMMKPTAAGKVKGTQIWTFTVDPQNRIVERMETNNQATLSVTVK